MRTQPHRLSPLAAFTLTFVVVLGGLAIAALGQGASGQARTAGKLALAPPAVAQRAEATASLAAPYAITPTVPLTDDGRALQVTGQGACKAESRLFDLRVRIVQSATHAFAEARYVDACAGRAFRPWRANAEVSGAPAFIPGAAEACTEAIEYARHGIAAEVRWCQEVQLVAAEVATAMAMARRNCPSPLNLNGICPEPTIPTPATPLPPTPTPIPQPGAPTNFSAGDAQEQAITVRWEDNSTVESGFTLWFRPEDGEWDTIRAWYHGDEPGTSTGEEYEYTHRNLESNTEYCYRVSAWNENGGNSTAVRCTSTLPDPPDAADLDIRFVDDDSIGLHVTFNSQATFMTIYHREQSESDWSYNRGEGVHVQNPPETEPSHADDLEPDTAYCVRVVLSNNGAEGPPSNEVCAETEVPPPEAPTYFRATDVTDTSITLEWLDISDREERYRLVRSRDAGGEDVEFDFGPQDGRVVFTDTGLEPDTQYNYWVVVYSEDNYSVSNIIEVVTDPDGGDGQAELRFNGSLNLTPTFPDPFESFTITWVACNVGSAATGDFTDAARLNDQSPVERAVDSLQPGECYQESAEHSGLPAGDHEWTVDLDSEESVDEVQENNNRSRYGFIIQD